VDVGEARALIEAAGQTERLDQLLWCIGQADKELKSSYSDSVRARLTPLRDD
jgi:hypothetical protein